MKLGSVCDVVAGASSWLGAKSALKGSNDQGGRALHRPYMFEVLQKGVINESTQRAIPGTVCAVRGYIEPDCTIASRLPEDTSAEGTGDRCSRAPKEIPLERI